MLYTLGSSEVTLPDYLSKIKLHSDIENKKKKALSLAGRCQHRIAEKDRDKT